MNSIRRVGLRGCLLGAGLALLVAACAPQAPKSSPGHLSAAQPVSQEQSQIPPPVQQLPFVPPPQDAQPLELYTVVIDHVPVKELLFALARDAGMNVDIHPKVEGFATLNAIDQTLPQILQRLQKQVSLRYRMDGNDLSIVPDTPYVQHYQIAYINMDRNSSSEINVTTQVATTGSIAMGSGGSNTTGSGDTGAGENNSSTKITSDSVNKFWTNLKESVTAIIGADKSEGGRKVMVHPESGLLTVAANAVEHEEVQRFLDRVLQNVQRQVLIEATIVEVLLEDQYQAGVEWNRLAGDFSYGQNLMLNGGAGYMFTYNNPVSKLGDLSAAIHLLEKYGNVRVLSSPKLMVLNNQTAILKVVDNQVYFVFGNTEVTENDANNRTTTKYTTQLQTVPVGLTISVTPQIAETNTIMLNVRPTVSRIVDYVQDPNPDLAKQGVQNLIPILRVREIESLLRVQSGNIAIIGGLMEDAHNQGTTGVPVLSKLPLVGDLFSYRDDKYTKTELAIFLRPVVIENPSIHSDMRPYRIFLPETGEVPPLPATGLPLNPEALY